MIYDIATYNITTNISLNEAVRLLAGVIGICLHIWLISQAIRRLKTLRWSGQNGALAHVAWTRIGNEAFAISLQLLMFLPSVYVASVPATPTALSTWGTWVIWSQAMVSVIITSWAWWRHQRAIRLDAILDSTADKERR